MFAGLVHGMSYQIPISLLLFLHAASSTDINDHKLLEHKLKEAHDAAQKSMESKTRFLSNMSHGMNEIRWMS